MGVRGIINDSILENYRLSRIVAPGLYSQGEERVIGEFRGLDHVIRAWIRD